MKFKTIVQKKKKKLEKNTLFCRVDTFFSCCCCCCLRAPFKQRLRKKERTKKHLPVYVAAICVHISAFFVSSVACSRARSHTHILSELRKSKKKKNSCFTSSPKYKRKSRRKKKIINLLKEKKRQQKNVTYFIR